MLRVINRAAVVNRIAIRVAHPCSNMRLQLLPRKFAPPMIHSLFRKGFRKIPLSIFIGGFREYSTVTGRVKP